MRKKQGGIFKVLGYLCLSSLIAFNLMIGLAYGAQSQKHLRATWSPRIIATTAYGKVRGFESSADTFAWKAIPYAKPPVGALRWKAPRDPDPWDGIREATKFCERCPQYSPGATSIVGNEDCLYLNIWRPRSEKTGLPVYFWIHGGGNSVLTASTDRYDGVKMARKSNMVVVTINYRLGPMGWFTHPALRDGENTRDDSGNYGTLDIIKALSWVRDNIEAFGGNPGNVTIAGVSAGAFNVSSLLIAPSAKGLFHRAISESGGARACPVATGEAHVNGVIERLLVDDGKAADKAAAKAYRGKMSNAEIKNYLRSKTVEEILRGHEMLFAPMIKFPYIFTDGTVIHGDGFDALTDPNRYNQVPIILGSNKEEMKLFMGLGSDYKKLDPATYQEKALRASYGWRVNGVDSIAKRLRVHKSQPDVYAYQFNYGAYNPKGYNAWPVDFKGVNYALRFGASHGLDISFFWGNPFFYGFEKLIFRQDNRLGYEALTDAMMSYVAQFARTGNPGASGGVLWRPWSNVEGEAKRILFDADDTKALIEMSTE